MIISDHSVEELGKNYMVNQYICLYLHSLVTRPSRGRGKEGQVHTLHACAHACQVSRKMSIKQAAMHVNGKASRKKYTEIHV